MTLILWNYKIDAMTSGTGIIIHMHSQKKSIIHLEVIYNALVVTGYKYLASPLLGYIWVIFFQAIISLFIDDIVYPRSYKFYPGYVNKNDTSSIITT